MAAERDVKKAYATPSLKKWGSVKDLTMNGKEGDLIELGGSFTRDQ